jgi:hypothetical protein
MMSGRQLIWLRTTALAVVGKTKYHLYLVAVSEKCQVRTRKRCLSTLIVTIQHSLMYVTGNAWVRGQYQVDE